LKENSVWATAKISIICTEKDIQKKTKKNFKDRNDFTGEKKEKTRMGISLKK